MKKAICILLTAVFMLGVKTDLYAQNDFLRDEDVLATSSDLEEIKALEDEMIASMETCGNEKAKDVTIHYEKSVKILREDIFALKTDDADAILDALDKGEHMWIVLAEMNGKQYELEITKGLPLNEEVDFTPEEEAEIRAHEGKWFVVGYGEVTDEESIWHRIMEQQEELKDCDQAVLIHDQPGLHYPILLGLKDNKAAVFDGIGYGYPMVGDMPQTRAATNEAGELLEPVDFWEIADRVEPYYHVSSDIVGGGGEVESKIPVRFLWISVAVLAAVSFFGKNRNRQRL